MGRQGNEIGQELDVAGLEWIDKFGWLRAQELGRLLWPGNEFSDKYGERICRKWAAKSYVIKRTLPARAGSAYVLSAGGVRVLEEYGIDAKTGKDWGETDPLRGGLWYPPTSWQHDLRAHGVLSILHSRGHEIMPEAQIKRETPGLPKYPDGLVKTKNGGPVFWLEVERAVKTGKAMEELAAAMIAVATCKGSAIGGWKPTGCMCAFADGETDTRGYQLDHMSRLKTAIRAQARADIEVIGLTLEMSGLGVVSIKAAKQVIQADLVARVAKRLSWVSEKGGGQWCAMGALRATIRQEQGHWLTEVVDTTDKRPQWQRTEALEPELIAQGRFDTITEAKRGCASVLSGQVDE